MQSMAEPLLRLLPLRWNQGGSTSVRSAHQEGNKVPDSYDAKGATLQRGHLSYSITLPTKEGPADSPFKSRNARAIRKRKHALWLGKMIKCLSEPPVDIQAIAGRVEVV